MICNDEEVLWAWLASGGLTPLEIRSLIAMDPDPAHLITDCQQDRGAFMEVPLSSRIRETLKRNAAPRKMADTAMLMAQHGIHIVTIMDEKYPERLRPLPDAPAILFIQGNMDTLAGPTAAMVGSRNASYAGLTATRRISETLSRAGIRIISGLAYGIDAAAHEGCLKGESPTISVLGCGLDQDYPAENAGLRKRILDTGGLIISEYAPGEKPLGWHFPFRNRIISGLGDCLIVMEARTRSGSMTTVQHALNQGKDVFVYPGDPTSPRSEGNHQLIREGAIYFTTAEDVMEDMQWLDKTGNVGQNIPGNQEEDPSLSQGEKQLMDQLNRGEQSFDQLCIALGFSAAQLNATLSMLQIRGLVQALPGKIYQKISPADF